MGDGLNTLVPLPMLAMPADSPRSSALLRRRAMRMATMTAAAVVVATQVMVQVTAEALLVIQVAAEALLAIQVTAEALLVIHEATTINMPQSGKG